MFPLPFSKTSLEHPDLEIKGGGKKLSSVDLVEVRSISILSFSPRHNLFMGLPRLGRSVGVVPGGVNLGIIFQSQNRSCLGHIEHRTWPGGTGQTSRKRVSIVGCPSEECGGLEVWEASDSPPSIGSSDHRIIGPSGHHGIIGFSPATRSPQKSLVGWD